MQTYQVIIKITMFTVQPHTRNYHHFPNISTQPRTIHFFLKELTVKKRIVSKSKLTSSSHFSPRNKNLGVNNTIYEDFSLTKGW